MDASAAIAATSGVLGALIGAGASLLVYRREQERARRNELAAALIAFATALDLMVAELRQSAPPRPRLRHLVRWLDTHLPELRWLTSPLANAFFARPTPLIERFQTAANRVLAVAPQATLREVEEAGELLSSWSEGAEDWDERWRLFRNRLQAHIREVAQSDAGTPAPPEARAVV